ncbi:MAG: FHA domain-containing protein [Anaerolineae bacterium]|nr:FHA domain-containing protein [Anaerolineae bacterium]
MTGPLNRKPMATPFRQAEETGFTSQTLLLLQFLPSGACLPLIPTGTVTLGRDPLLGAPDNLIDLSQHNAQTHGVSRAHCQLRPKNNRLYVADLNSTNGTYLNGVKLNPHREYLIAHGDRLIMGTLHIVVAFGDA